MSLQNKSSKTFIYLVPTNFKTKYEHCNELIIIEEFINLGYKIFPIYNFYFIRILYFIYRYKID